MIRIIKIAFLSSLTIAWFCIESVAQAWSNSGNNYTTGNVGIGTSASSYKLDILNQSGQPQNLLRIKIDGAPTDEFKIINGTGVSGQFIPAIVGYHDSDNREALGFIGVIGTANDTGVNPITYFDSRTSGGPVSTRPLFSWGSYGNNKMLLSASGDLSIGTSVSMASRLNIADGNGGEQLRISRGTGTVRFAQDLNQDNLYLFNGDASQTYMFWKANGYVGVGTQNPDAKLTVKGSIHAEEVKVDLSVPGPDYVFEESYQLLPLHETKAFIKQNKHLPEVPSARELEENGIKVGEMNMLLLKKVEELTLHLIRQQEEIDALKKELHKP